MGWVVLDILIKIGGCGVSCFHLSAVGSFTHRMDLSIVEEKVIVRRKEVELRALYREAIIWTRRN